MLSEVTMQPVHRIGQGGLLVVHRDHHVEHGHARRRAANAAFGRDSNWTR